MAHYILRRLIVLPILLLIVYTAVFFMARMAPGGPWNPDIPVPPEVLHNLRRFYQADEPLWVQYWSYLSRLLQGNFGPSYYFPGRDVSEMIAHALPVSMQLGAVAMLVATIMGVSLGILSAVRHNTGYDYCAMILALSGISVPPFVVAPLLVAMLAIHWHILPTSGWNGIISVSAVLPIFTLAIGPAAGLARYTRNSLLEVIPRDFIRTACGKGLDSWAVIMRHALPNGLIPVVTVIGLYLSRVLTGAFFIEAIFSIPGMGRLLVDGIANRDYPVILHVSLVITVVIAMMNLIIDLMYAYIDPRIRYE